MKFFKKVTAISLAILSTVSITNLALAGKAKSESVPTPWKRCRTIKSKLRYSRNRQLLKRNPKLLEALGGISKINDMDPDNLNKKIEKHRIKSRIIHEMNWFVSFYLADDIAIDGQTIDTVIDEVNSALAQEPRSNLNGIEISSNGENVTIVGDTHGDFNSTQHIIKYFLQKFKSNPNEKILFLGDYVDRGYDNVKNFIAICALKAALPNNVYMIRGNHEDLSQNQRRSDDGCLLNELDERYEDDGGSEEFAPKFASVYDNLPLSAVIDGQVFCVHGGIPQPFDNPNYFSSGQYANDLLWSDPYIPAVDGRWLTPPGNEFYYNKKRGGGTLFTLNALASFLERNNFRLVVRAHQAVTKKESFDICQLLYSAKLFTVFSAQGHQSLSRNQTEGFVIIYNPSRTFYKTIDELPIS